MKKEKLNISQFVNGWFIGDFEPSLLKTCDFEVAVKRYKADEREEAHYHKIAQEFTVIIDGVVEMNGKKYCANDIVVTEPGTATDFVALTNTTTLVVKIPSIKNDKYVQKD